MDQSLDIFHPFPRLPLELRDKIWKDSLPISKTTEGEVARRVIRVKAYWSRSASTQTTELARLRLGHRYEPQKKFRNSPEIFDLSLSMVNKECRRVYLKAFPCSLPLRRRGPGRRRVATLRFDDDAIIYIENTFEFFYNRNIFPSLDHPTHHAPIPFPAWAKTLKHVAIESLGFNTTQHHFQVYRTALARYFSNVVSIQIVGGLEEVYLPLKPEEIRTVLLPKLRECIQGAYEELAPPGSAIPVVDYSNYYCVDDKDDNDEA